ncbi:MAG TPA: M48 family metallopeptidase [Acidobacteriota bacterium]|nr:M48 family metallopeptidase [Acidobacteriota bacterium]
MKTDASGIGSWIVAILLLVCVAAALVPAAVSAQSTDDAATAGAPADDAGWGEMTPERRREALAYSHTRDVFYFVTTVYTAVVLLVILYTGLSARLLVWAERLARQRFAGMIIYLAMFIVLMGVMAFPFEYYLGFHLEHAYGLSHQSFGAWMGDQLKGLAVLLVLLTIVVGILYALLRRRPRTWWLWFGAASVPLLIILVILAPIVITPLFYDVTEMENTPLKAQILSLASASGIDESRVFVMDASKNTNRLNAYVTGLRGTKRIVLYDNLIAHMAPEEVLFVVGHEMGHYLKHHIWLGLGVAVMLIFIFGYLAHRLMGGIIHAHRKRLGFDRPSSFASLPLFYLAAIIFGFVFSPVQNAVSRSFERSADAFGMVMTGDGEAAARAFEKLADVNLSNPDPSLFIKLWRYDHPPLSERVRFVRAAGGGQGGAGGATGADRDSLRFDGE